MTSEGIRERLSRTAANSSLLNSSAVSNTSAFEDKLSPLWKSRRVNDIQRYENLRNKSLQFKLKIHISFLVLLFADFVVFNSSILSFILFYNSVPLSVLSIISIFLLIYLLSVLVLLLIELKFPKASNSVSRIIEDFCKPKETSVIKTEDSILKSPDVNVLTPTNADHSWVDSHKFGTPNSLSIIKSDTSLRHSQYNKKSPNVSHLVNSLDTSPTLNTSLSANWKSPTAYRTLTDSIHTRKQLDVLLKSHSNDPPVDVNASQSSYFSSLWSVFEFGRSGPIQLNNTYQVSEETVEDPKQLKTAYKMKIGKDGRTEVTMLRRRQGTNEIDTEEDNDDELTKLHKIMNSAKTSPENQTGILKRTNSVERGRCGVRRRSHSSPDRSGDPDSEFRYRNGELLTEEQQKCAEFRVRSWIRNTIILPLAEQIEEINRLLEKEHTNPPLQIGISTVDALKLALMERDFLRSSNLPFILPFLSVHTNQAYIVSRIKELSSSEFMDVYKWNSGGMEPTDDKLKPSQIVRREWNDSLPTDAVLIFELFAVYMDAQLNSNCLVREHRLDQPFTSRYVIKAPKKPVASQRSPFNFYLHQASISPPHFEFIHNDCNGSPVKCVVARQAPNLFRAIAQFVHFVKEEYQGYIDKTNIGPTGINIATVLY